MQHSDPKHRPASDGAESWIDGKCELSIRREELDDGRACFVFCVIRPRGKLLPVRQILPLAEVWAESVGVSLPPGAADQMVAFIKRLEDLQAGLGEGEGSGDGS